MISNLLALNLCTKIIRAALCTARMLLLFIRESRGHPISRITLMGRRGISEWVKLEESVNSKEVNQVNEVNGYMNVVHG